MKSFAFDDFGPAAGAALRGNAGKLDQALAGGLRPPPRMKVSEWASAYRRFPEDAPIPGRWRHETAPELVEIMDAMSPDDPCQEGIVMKCAQSGGSASAENFIGFISDLAPGPMLFVQATFQAALDWAAEKFWPMVDATPRLNPDRGGTIRAQGLSNGDGSTSKKILFARSSGYVLLAGANSAAGLRQRTVRYAVEDDLDQWPDDLDGQGSPEGMVDERLKVYRSRGLSKRIKISTPTIKGASKIGAAYRGSDRRRYHLKCPECGSRFVPDWGDIQWPDGDEASAHLVAPCCGSVIEHWRKGAMKLPDGWLSMNIDGQDLPRVLTEEEFQDWRSRMPRSVRRGFHLPGEISSFQSWAEMATAFRDAQGDLNKLKTWTNLKRGIEFELKGDQPDYELLKQLREQDWGHGQVPNGVIATTLGGDVQGDGIYVELRGWGPRREMWMLDARFIPGETDVEGEGAWAALDAYSKRGVVYPGGKTLPIDQECIDAGYHTAAAQAYCAKRPRRLAVFGRAGWRLPALGRGEVLNYEKRGKRAGQAKKRAEDKAFIVGTYGIKLSWYGYLRASLKALAEASQGETVQPLGRVRVSRDAPDEWFEQVTAETVVTEVKGGFPTRVWKPMPGRPNHWLDCAVYNFAAFEKLMLDRLSDDDWGKLRAERYAAEDPRQQGLFDQPLAPATLEAEPAPADVPASRGDWIGGDSNWL